MSTREIVTIATQADRDKASRWAQKVSEGTIIEFRKKTRSHEQNAKLHAMLGEVAEQVVWYGCKLLVEDWKNIFTASLRKAQVVPGIDAGTVVPLGIHTSTMTVDEMSNMIEAIYAFGAERGVVFKEPQEQSESGALSPAPDSADAPALSASAEGGDTSPSSPSSLPEWSGNPERDILIRYARDVLPMAADTDLSLSTVKEVEKQWAADELTKLSPAGKEKARAISESMRAIHNDPARLEGVLEHYAHVLECTVEELQEKAYG